ncbi:efflux RND transporter permease subunit [Phenylobacterium sp.]|uniref:efflux RND transporter permease subunit n=1 Tax=Phenylobacterium sp. TaxID=1871053 RepID=UPI001985D382|nr:efflux RND transporter permease subunit [Phenylobacterium sp.]MBC7168283.1 efflux RND transporter permease subunit [Phenylobacterium sp.]
MSQAEGDRKRAKQARGPVAYMIRDGVAANLLMAFILVAGVFSYTRLVQETFPEFSLATIQITVPYPGASPQEVEEGVVEKIEERVEGVEGVREVTSVASEGLGAVTLQLETGVDVQRALDDVNAQIDQITSFPSEAEEPSVQELTNRQRVMRILVHGDVAERAIKEIAYRLEDELSALPQVSYVETSAVRADEISIEVSQDRLRALGLSLPDVARIVGASSLDLPAGTIDADERALRVRTLGQNYDAQDFEAIVLVAQPDGTTLRLGDVAQVQDGFADSDLAARYNGEPAAFVEVYRTADEKVLTVADAVQSHLKDSFGPGLPEAVSYTVWEDNADILRQRIGTLLRSAAIGLVLVLIALALFLDVRLAAWVAVGLLVSYVGTLAVMLAFGQSINQLSLFGFILAIGIVVDDAIVVGENVFAERERGLSGEDASIAGVTRVLRPVVFSVLTTVAAFTPLLFVPGTFGNILGAIPVVVIALLLLSLAESLFILPHHLAGIPAGEPKSRVVRGFGRVRDRVNGGLQRFVNGPLDKAVRFSVAMPLVVCAGALALVAMSLSLVVGGHLKTSFFPDVEAETVSARVEMPTGATAEETLRVTRQVQAAGERAARALAEDRGGGGGFVEGVFLLVGQAPAEGGPGGGGAASRARPELGTVEIKLVGAAERDISASALEERWREAVGELPQARSVSFSAELIGFGAPVQVELSHPDEAVLTEATRRLASEIAAIEGVFDVQNDQDQGLTELRFRLTPAARTLGLTLQEVAGQVRAAFFGAEALRVQRGREEVRAYVRLPEEQRDSLGDVEDYWISLGEGEFAPVRQVTEVSLGTAPAVINRKDGARVTTVTADVDEAAITGDEASARLADDILPRLTERYPDLTWSFGGQREEQQRAQGAIAGAFVVALFAIYALLAIPLKSYVQPLVIMAAIPAGLVGSFLGLLLLGKTLGLLGVLGVVGLAGVIVNDGVVLMDFINERLERGEDVDQAVVEGTKSRFRPVMLTTTTTFLGVAPIAFAQSLQAQFLVPMAAALAFGALVATVIQMVLVPALAKLQVSAAMRRREKKARGAEASSHDPATSGTSG